MERIDEEESIEILKSENERLHAENKQLKLENIRLNVALEKIYEGNFTLIFLDEVDKMKIASSFYRVKFQEICKKYHIKLSYEVAARRIRYNFKNVNGKYKKLSFKLCVDAMYFSRWNIVVFEIKKFIEERDWSGNESGFSYDMFAEEGEIKIRESLY
jgi:hypothetical protein